MPCVEAATTVVGGVEGARRRFVRGCGVPVPRVVDGMNILGGVDGVFDPVRGRRWWVDGFQVLTAGAQPDVFALWRPTSNPLSTAGAKHGEEGKVAFGGAKML